MPYDENVLNDKINQLANRMLNLSTGLREVKYCHATLIGLKDIVTKVPNPNPDPNIIGSDLIEQIDPPFDEQTGEVMSTARRNAVFDKRVAQADILLSQTI